MDKQHLSPETHVCLVAEKLHNIPCHMKILEIACDSD